MARSDSLSEEVEEFDDHLYREERVSFADTVEWLFGNAFYLLSRLLMPWTWFQRRPDGIDMLEGQTQTMETQTTKPSLVWRLRNVADSATSQTGYGVSYLFDIIEMFFAKAFEIVVLLLSPWRWFRRTKKRPPMERMF